MSTTPFIPVKGKFALPGHNPFSGLPFGHEWQTSSSSPALLSAARGGLARLRTSCIHSHAPRKSSLETSDTKDKLAPVAATARAPTATHTLRHPSTMVPRPQTQPTSRGTSAAAPATLRAEPVRPFSKRNIFKPDYRAILATLLAVTALCLLIWLDYAYVPSTSRTSVPAVVAGTTITPQPSPAQTNPHPSARSDTMPFKASATPQRVSPPRQLSALRSANAQRTIRQALPPQAAHRTRRLKSSPSAPRARTITPVTKHTDLTQRVKPIYNDPLDNPQSVRQFVRKLQLQYAQQGSKHAAWNQNDWSKRRAHSRLTDAPEPFLR